MAVRSLASSFTASVALNGGEFSNALISPRESLTRLAKQKKRRRRLAGSAQGDPANDLPRAERSSTTV